MRCETFLDRYDALDAGECPGFFLNRHLARCPECRELVSREREALAAYRGESESAGRIPANLEDRVMTAVRLSPRPRRVISFRDWVLAGLVIALSMALIPFGEEFDRTKELFGSSFALPLSLVLALVLTSYMAVFISSHMSELLPLVRRRPGSAGLPRC